MSPKQTIICVFCGSSPGTSPAHLSAARSLAQTFHALNISLVYGGGTTGLMGELAKTLVALSGPDSVHGVIPNALIQVEAHRQEESRDAETNGVNGVNGDDALNSKMTQKQEVDKPDQKVFGKTTVVPDMHTRKRLMSSLVCEGGEGSGFIALAGGYGTLEELMEVVTWNQLGIHDRGVCVYNVEGYWDGIVKWVREAVEAGFVQEGNKEILGEAGSAEGCVGALREYRSAAGRFRLNWEDEGSGKN